jgi:hypothetical protein
MRSDAGEGWAAEGKGKEEGKGRGQLGSALERQRPLINVELSRDSLSYPRVELRMVASMSDSLRSLSMRSSLASMPTTQFLVNERAPVGREGQQQSIQRRRSARYHRREGGWTGEGS